MAESFWAFNMKIFNFYYDSLEFFLYQFETISFYADTEDIRKNPSKAPLIYKKLIKILFILEELKIIK
jgi:hypothetical protein